MLIICEEEKKGITTPHPVFLPYGETCPVKTVIMAKRHDRMKSLAEQIADLQDPTPKGERSYCAKILLVCAGN